ncbi:MAG: MOSC domain-containing protein [Betaproteobacteria bacterium]|nr:MOSC domain-containing protein [Betaproteobacteria bacterium]MBM3384009.1 MOSC domain-containing protein [Betaproteobacteria bacterium]
MHIAALHLYPVKSCAALSMQEAQVEAPGLAGDRRYAILGPSGRVLTQRDLPLLATIRPTPLARGLALDLGGLAKIEVPADGFAAACEAQVWGRRAPACAAPAGVNASLAAFLGAEARLVRVDAGAERSFADSKPVLVVATASLRALNQELAGAVGMERFRGNLVVEGAAPFAELGWPRFGAGEAEFAFAQACERCEVTTIDQASGSRRGEEPLRTLASGFDAVFGACFRVARPGRIRVGDTLLPG